MKACVNVLVPVACSLLCPSLFSQGTVLFENLSAGAGINAPLYDVDGKTGLTRDFLVQLYVAPEGGSLQPVGDAITFTAAGYFLGLFGAIVLGLRCWVPRR